ncbi:MAG: hypothetical protein IJ822_04365 [Pyramidobacter sp.]|nr:hypothetical protein [Pyramidobacter sp.]MBQ8129426.1 hypothetical protein [Clostridia bacterium]MBR1895994.1 hypothetical protein [Pyramidobacter sp.]
MCQKKPFVLGEDVARALDEIVGINDGLPEDFREKAKERAAEKGEMRTIENTKTIDLLADNLEIRVGEDDAGEKRIMLTLVDRDHHIEMHGALDHEMNKVLIAQLIKSGLELIKEEHANDDRN